MKLHHRSMSAACLFALVFSLSACGGGGDSSSPPPPPPPPPTPLPETFTITAKAAADVSAPAEFSSNSATVAGLTFNWSFGDGTGSTEASPKHSYSKPGDYEVVLNVLNSGGQSKETRFRIAVNNQAAVHGLVCNGPQESGWCWQQPRPSGNPTTDVFFLDAATGWKVGSNGEIFKTTDSGKNWVAQASGVRVDLINVQFSSATDGWVLGNYGTLLRTSDGGATWIASKLPDNTGSTLTVIDSKRAYVGQTYNNNIAFSTADGGKTWVALSHTASTVAKNGTLWYWDYQDNSIYKSTNLGASFSKQFQIPVSNNYSSPTLSVIDENRILISLGTSQYNSSTGNYEPKYYAWRSTDGGSNWTTVALSGLPTQTQYYYPALNILRTSPSDHTILASVSSAPNSIYRSTDDGENWTAAKAPADQYYFDWTKVFALSGSTLIYSTGTLDNLYLSDDVGLTWKKTGSATSSNESLAKVRAIDNNTLLLTSNSGVSYLSKDKSATWQAIAGASNTQQQEQLSAWFLDSKHGFAHSSLGELRETSDGGLTWSIKLPGLTAGFGDIRFTDAANGWLRLGDGRVNKSADGGKTWAPITLPGGAFSYVWFNDAKVGWGRGQYGAGFYVTADGGVTWKTVTPPYNTNALLVDEKGAYLAVGNGGQISRSSDGGATWTNKVSGTDASFYNVISTGGKTIWALSYGGSAGLWKSEDGGENWFSVPVGIIYGLINDIAVGENGRAWLVGAQGLVMASVDGGKTWARQPSGTARDLTRIQMLDAKAGWISGSGGTLLATGTGGF